MDRTLTVGIGSATEHLGVDQVVDLGPLHPAAHGAYRLRLRVGPDAVVREAVPLVGHLHRGAEKLYEVRDYRQVMALANRHDWWAAFANELLVAHAVEQMTGMTPPPRAVQLRVLLCELTRAMAHLGFLTPLTRDPAAPVTNTAGTDAAVAGREALQRVLEEASGGRIHFMANRVGGLREDVPAAWFDHVAAALDTVTTAAAAISACTVEDAEFVGRHTGAGVLSLADATALGVSGPVGRASGLDVDLRRDDPAPGYDQLAPLRTITRTTGDALARVACQLDEVTLAVQLARQCLIDVPDGPVNVRLPSTIAPPEGSVYVWGEAPLGIAGVHLVSRGERTPWRLRLRTASFNNVQALSCLLPGTSLEQLPVALASFAVVVGDIDK
ncbi:NADH-quinone oxidoreductase subunit D [Rhodococcus sp. X156]|uniref:NADH-quinone oxidoreductase subunit D n=1 Tax=Rhodococcus sp. X156 TaxID=2499145 RepID=UPI0019D05313|nr:NADH-quinone oxidoreductase subunit D [Rhodococcus sp. X156]